MPPWSGRWSEAVPDWTWPSIAFVLATGLRLGLASVFPTIHGGDASARLANPTTAVLGYQLPFPQLFVMAGRAVADDPKIVRFVFCVWGGVLAAGATALSGLVFGRAPAPFAAILFSSAPLLIHYSVVPYQEPVAYALLAWAFYFLFRDREGLASCLMVGACSSRYEVWLFLPVFVWRVRSRRSALLASVPVLGWTLWWRGLAPGGLYVLDIDSAAGRWSRVAYLASKFVEYETWIVPALALAGLLIAWRQRLTPVLQTVGITAAVMTFVIGLGHEYPPGSGRMSERLIHLVVLLALALSALALGELARHSRLGLALCFLATLTMAARDVRFEVNLLRAAELDPDLTLAREVARSIESVRAAGECVSVRAPFVDPALLQAYVGKVESSFGDVDLARVRARALATAAPDRDRIAAHLRAPTGTVREMPGCPLLVVVDDAGEGANDLSDFSGRGAPQLLRVVKGGVREARIYRNPR